MAQDTVIGSAVGIDPDELRDWYESLEDILYRYGSTEAGSLLKRLDTYARRRGVDVPYDGITEYINTIPPEDQPEYPGDLALERRIKSLIRWNSVAMVVRGNKNDTGIGGHISTYASSATLYEVGYNHFFRGRTENQLGDMIYFQGHAAPGMYARAFAEGRLDEEHLDKFRREIPRGTGLSSYPHPWLMPDFWQFPTVSMGLGPITSLYHARFLRYLQNRGLLDTSESTVWAFLGDGEMDEPESLGAITLPVREKLDNVIWVINCNLQRLDGPVRGNGKIVQEMEGVFRGAGWNVIKCLWGSGWDELFAAELRKGHDGKLAQRMGEVVDGEMQKYIVEGGAYVREHFFGADPELLDLVADMSDEEIAKLRRGGHDPEKVYAAYARAKSLKNGRPTVILVQTVKGWGLGTAGEGLNVAHNTKKMTEDQWRDFRDRFDIPVEDVSEIPFVRFEPDSPEQKYIESHRETLGGHVPTRVPSTERLEVPTLESFKKFLEGTGPDKAASTTFVLSMLLAQLLRDKKIGERIVPIIPDEARTFGMESLFKQVGIYSPHGQLYEPVDRAQLMYYREATDGQLLEEGITEAGAISSFIAAGTAYSNLNLPMVPFYIYYSMFGFQRVGDLIWLAGDSRAKGFLCGGTSGRTTLNGEGLQHEDGQSQMVASTVPNLVAYDPAFGYELTAIVQDGIRRMYGEGEEIFYYLSVYNEAYYLPAMPDDPEGKVLEGILRGLYRFNQGGETKSKVRPQLFGSGPILNQVLRAQEILQEKFDIASDVWSATSYNELARDARAAARWNRRHPGETPRGSHLTSVLGGVDGPFIAASDNVRAWADQIREWVPGRYVVLGTDGYGRSATREELRRHFEVDAENIAYATLEALAADGQYDAKRLPEDLKALGLDPDQVDPLTA